MKTRLVVVTLFIALLSQAQPYEQSIGARGGVANGVAYKMFKTETVALEGVASTLYNGGFMVSGYYEIHGARAFDVEELYWYYGGGAHMGSWSTYSSFTNNTTIGLDAIIGLEYVIKEIPISIGADWIPSFNLIGYSGFWGGNGGLSVRYRF